MTNVYLLNFSILVVLGFYCVVMDNRLAQLQRRVSELEIVSKGDGK